MPTRLTIDTWRCPFHVMARLVRAIRRRNMSDQMARTGQATTLRARVNLQARWYKGFNTEKQARITEATEQKRIWALRAVCGRPPSRHYSYLRALRGPRLFLCCENRKNVLPSLRVRVIFSRHRGGRRAGWVTVLDSLLSGCDPGADVRQYPSRPTGQRADCRGQKAAPRETEAMTARECLGQIQNV
jgi:hypothetical protein